MIEKEQEGVSFDVKYMSMVQCVKCLCKKVKDEDEDLEKAYKRKADPSIFVFNIALVLYATLKGLFFFYRANLIFWTHVSGFVSLGKY